VALKIRGIAQDVLFEGRCIIWKDEIWKRKANVSEIQSVNVIQSATFPSRAAESNGTGENFGAYSERPMPGRHTSFSRVT
jgi:hypothetical protein